MIRHHTLMTPMPSVKWWDGQFACRTWPRRRRKRYGKKTKHESRRSPFRPQTSTAKSVIYYLVRLMFFSWNFWPKKEKKQKTTSDIWKKKNKERYLRRDARAPAAGKPTLLWRPYKGRWLPTNASHFLRPLVRASINLIPCASLTYSLSVINYNCRRRRYRWNVDSFFGCNNIPDFRIAKLY